MSVQGIIHHIKQFTRVVSFSNECRMNFHQVSNIIIITVLIEHLFYWTCKYVCGPASQHVFCAYDHSQLDQAWIPDPRTASPQLAFDGDATRCQS